MKSVFFILVISSQVFAQSGLRAPASMSDKTNPLLMKTNPPINSRMLTKRAFVTFDSCINVAKAKDLNFRNDSIEGCIGTAIADANEPKDYVKCLELADLANGKSRKNGYRKQCREGLAFSFCMASPEAKNLVGRIDCLVEFPESTPYAECGGIHSEVLKSLEKAPELKSKLTKKQKKVLQKDFCEISPYPLPPNVVPATGQPSQR